MKPGSEPTRRAPESLLGIWGSIFFLKCVWHCWTPVGSKGTCSSLLGSWQSPAGCRWELCGAKGGWEVVQLSGQLQPTLLACFVPEVVMCLGCHLLVKSGFCLTYFFVLHFGLP